MFAFGTENADVVPKFPGSGTSNPIGTEAIVSLSFFVDQIGLP
jgi:hypothetical protein